MLPSESTTDDSQTERSVSGIVVHPVVFLTASFGVGLFIAAGVYLLSSHPFTKANARNALNWHLSVFLLVFSSAATFLLGTTLTDSGGFIGWAPLAAIDSAVDMVGTILTAGGIVLVMLSMVAWLLTIVFTIVAIFNALSGNAWVYPFAPDLVSRFE